MKILVTGGAGYLGSELLPRLLGLGHEVTVLDSFKHGVPSLAAVGGHAALTVYRGDVRDEELLIGCLHQQDAVVHLAALVGSGACEAARGEAVSTNLWATTKLVELMRPHQILIFPCTNSGYGRGGALPVTETDPMRPLSLYGTTKARAEEAVLRHPLGVSLRFATLYGPSARMRLDLLVNEFVYYAANRKPLAVYERHFRRCVLHVFDAASAIIWSISHRCVLFGRAWNVGAENLTKADLCRLIQTQEPRFSWNATKGRDPDQRDYAVSSDAFHAATGWSPSVKITDGIGQLLRLYRQPFDSPAWRNA